MKRKLWIAGIVLVALIGGAVFVLREVTFAHYEGSREAAQAALDGTVLTKIDDAVPYTGGMQGFLFTGTDKQGRQVYVWTQEGNVVASIHADKGLTQDQAIAAAQKPVWAEQLVRADMKNQPLHAVLEVERINPGPVLSTSKAQFRTAPSKFVWEIYGKLADGSYGYTYLDFASGHVVWQIGLEEPK